MPKANILINLIVGLLREQQILKVDYEKNVLDFNPGRYEIQLRAGDGGAGGGTGSGQEGGFFSGIFEFKERWSLTYMIGLIGGSGWGYSSGGFFSSGSGGGGGGGGGASIIIFSTNPRPVPGEKVLVCGNADPNANTLITRGKEQFFKFEAVYCRGGRGNDGRKGGGATLGKSGGSAGSGGTGGGIPDETPTGWGNNGGSGQSGANWFSDKQDTGNNGRGGSGWHQQNVENYRTKKTLIDVLPRTYVQSTKIFGKTITSVKPVPGSYKSGQLFIRCVYELDQYGLPMYEDPHCSVRPEYGMS